MMKTTIFLFMTICLFSIMLPHGSAQMFSSTISFEATVPVDTITIGIGKTQISGCFCGINMSKLVSVPSLNQYENMLNITNLTGSIDFSLFNSLHGFPLFATSEFSSVNRVTILNTSILENQPATPSELQQLAKEIQSYENVTISIDQGLAFFGTNEKNVYLSSSAPFALSGFMKIPVYSKEYFDTFFVLSQSSRVFNNSEDISILYPFSSSCNMSLISSEGSMLWNEIGADYFLLIEHKKVTITDKSPLHLYPLTPPNQTNNVPQLEVQINPAEQQDIDITQLFSSLLTGDMADQNLSLPLDFLKNNMFGASLSSISPVINGGFLLADSNETVLIDGTVQSISSFVFIQGKTVIINLEDSLPFVKKISAHGDLIFLNDHFVSPSAKENENGFYFPIFPVLIWIAALLCFFLFKYKLTRKGDEEYKKTVSDKKMITALFGLRILSIGFIFFLLDLEIKQTLGTSVFHLISTHFSWPVFLVVLIFQLFLWFLGYFCFAFPFQYLLITSFKYLPVKKIYRKPLGKSIGLLGIWLFAGLYMILVLNMILFFVKPLLPSLPMV